MTKHSQIVPNANQEVTDTQLKELGLELILAWKKRDTPNGKQKNAERQKRFREAAAKRGLVPCSLGLVPKKEMEQLKAIAKQLREQGIPLADAVASIIPPKIVEVEKVVKIPRKLSHDQITVLRVLASGAWQAKLIRWLARSSL